MESMASERFAELARLVELTSDAVALCDIDGTVLHVNHQLIALVAASREDIVGADIKDLVYSERFERSGDHLPPFGLDGTDSVCQLKLPDGSFIPVRVRAQRVSPRTLSMDDERGTADRMLVVINSLEEQHARDRQTRRLFSELQAVNRRLSGTLSVIMTAAGSKDLPSLLDAVLNKIVEALDADGSSIYFSESGGFKLRGISYGLARDYVPEFIPYGSGIPTYVLREQRSCSLTIVPAAYGKGIESSVFFDIDTHVSTRLRVENVPPYRTLIAVPVFFGTQVLGIALVFGIFILTGILVVTALVTRSLRQLSRAVATIDQEHLALDLELSGQDEAAQLYRQIQFMLRRIRELIADIRRTESEKRDSEIQALQAQINPHFLYNTLNTIRFLATVQGADNIGTVSQALSSMLHVNLSKDKLIPVPEEIQYLKNYLEIQEYRFTGKFTSWFSADDAAQQALIPKLLLQPVVENALLHGIVPMERPGILQIKFFCADGSLHVRIKDNGKGMDPETLEALAHPSGEAKGHIGVTNVRGRLRLLFGDDASLAIESEPNLYTAVEFTIPYITRENAEQYL